MIKVELRTDGETGVVTEEPNIPMDKIHPSARDQHKVYASLESQK